MADPDGSDSGLAAAVELKGPLDDVGVVVVHGIGNQTKGSTLRGFVDPLLAHLAAQVQDPDGGQRRLPKRPRLLPIDCDDSDAVRIEVPVVRKELDGNYGNDSESKTWLIREAHWAEAFDPPGRSQTALWLATVGPWFVYFFIVRLWRRFKADTAHSTLGVVTAVGILVSLLSLRQGDTATAVVAFAVSVAASAVSFWFGRADERHLAAMVIATTILVIYPLAALLTVGVTALAIVGLLPLPGAEKVRKLQTAIAGTIGDTYAVVGSPRRERVMRDVIRCAIDEVCDSIKEKSPVVLVCHSQGAALTYRLLRTDWPRVLKDRRVTLVTYGSAIVPIHVLERQGATAEIGWFRRAINVIGLVSFLALAVLLVRAASLADTPVWWWGVVGALLAGATLSALRDARCLDSVDPDHLVPESRSSKEHEDDRKDGRYTAAMDAADELAGKDDHKQSTRADSHDARDRRWEDVPVDLVRSLEFEVGAEADSRMVSLDAAKRLLPHWLGGKVDCGGDLFIPGLAAWTEFRWVDIYARWDPVPNGPLLLARPRSIPADDDHPDRTKAPTWSDRGDLVLPETYSISNDQQPWLDHVTYRTNVEDTVGRFALEIAASTENPVGERLSAYEHALGANELPMDEYEKTLPNKAAEQARSDRRHRSGILFGGQILTLLVAAGLLSYRSDRIAPLGEWALAALPRWVVSGLSGIVEVVPSWIRDVFAGGARDQAHGLGVALALLAVAAVFLIETAVVRLWQRRASTLFASGQERPALWWVALPLAVAVGIGVLTWRVIDSPEPVEPLDIGIGLYVTNERALGTVTLQPLRDGADAAIVVEVTDDEVDTPVRLKGGEFVVSKVEVPGAEECETTLTAARVKITCTPIEPVIPTG